MNEQKGAIQSMKTESFTLTFPGNSSIQGGYLDVPTAGTALAGLPQDAVLVVNTREDVTIDLVGGGGDGVITVRASAADTLRFRVKGLNSTQSVDVQVTWLD